MERKGRLDTLPRCVYSHLPVLPSAQAEAGTCGTHRFGYIASYHSASGLEVTGASPFGNAVRSWTSLWPGSVAPYRQLDFTRCQHDITALLIATFTQTVLEYMANLTDLGIVLLASRGALLALAR